MDTLTVVITTHNSASTIRDTLESVLWADEIIVVDGESTDETSSICAKYKVKFVTHPNHPMLNINKNVGFGLARSTWILSLDSDEDVTPGLKEEMQKLLATLPSYDGYWIARRNIFLEKVLRHGPWSPDWQLRLFRRGKGFFPCRDVHETLVVRGCKSRLKTPLLHHFVNSTGNYLKKLDQYSNFRSIRYAREEKKFSLLRMLCGPCRQFLENYIFRGSFLDGYHGLIASVLYSFESFLVHAKLWEIQNLKSEIGTEVFHSDEHRDRRR